MKKNSNPLMLDGDKQKIPMTGEVAPEDARAKGIAFAAKEKARMLKAQKSASQK